MVRFNTIYNSGWWGQGGKNAHDDVDLSPQMMKTTTDLAASKKNDFGFGKQANEIIKILFPFEDAPASFEEMSMAHPSAKDKMKCHSLTDTLDTKTSTEEQNITCDNPSTAGNVGDRTQAGNEDDSSTIVSSSSSAVFELFDDVSILTNEDSLFDNSDIDGLNVNVRISFLTDNIEEGDNAFGMVHCSRHFGVFETRHSNEHKDSTESFLISDERIVYNGSMVHSQFAFFSGVNFEEGFTPSDELRMA